MFFLISASSIGHLFLISPSLSFLLFLFFK